MLTGRTIWDATRLEDGRQRLELMDLIHFKGYFYCGFHEGVIHHSHPAGQGRLIRSPDGETWETAGIFSWQGGDVREPKLSLTPENQLLVNTSIRFVSQQPREDGGYYQLNAPKDGETDREDAVSRQSVTWLSSDGTTWSSAYCCPSGINTWRWEITWYNGMGYSVGYSGKDGRGTLYRTRDGKSFRPLVEGFFPDGLGNEASLEFLPNGDACCLLRAGARRSTPKPDCTLDLPMLGIGRAPFYQEWSWHPLHFEWPRGTITPMEDVLRAPFGGPQLRRLSNGRIMAVGRCWGPGQTDGTITLFQLDADRRVLRFIDDCDGTSYGGVVEKDSRLWMAYSNTATTEVRFASCQLPD